MNRCLGGPECGLCFTRSGRAVPLSAREWHSCLGGPECGLCLARSGRAVPLNTWTWRRLLGPVTQADRLGYFRRERCDRVASRSIQTPPSC